MGYMGGGGGGGGGGGASYEGGKDAQLIMPFINFYNFKPSNKILLNVIFWLPTINKFNTYGKIGSLIYIWNFTGLTNYNWFK